MGIDEPPSSLEIAHGEIMAMLFFHLPPPAAVEVSKKR